MVMYEDDCKGNLLLKYDVVPSVSEVIRDVLEAPIESGETFQNKKKGVKAILDKYILIDANLGKKAEETVVAEVTAKMNWKAIRSKEKNLFGFELPESAESEQKSLMGA